MAVLPLFIACTCNDDDNDNNSNYGSTVIDDDDIPSTKVFAQGVLLLNYHSTKGEYNPNMDYGYGIGVWPNEKEGWEAAKFTIRIDASFPDVISQNVAKYWDKEGGPNLGKVYTIYPWSLYNDRDFDYYKVNEKTGKNIGMFRYVLDPSGTNVTKALMEVPDMKEYFKWLMAQDDVEYKYLLAQVLADWDEYTIIWYVAKETGMKNGWQVNGYLKKNEWDMIKDETNNMIVTDPVDAPDNVEIITHHQDYKNWAMIKTTIHIRTDVQHLQVKIPVSKDNIVEANEFTTRTYSYNIFGSIIRNEIIHDDNGITIDITNIDYTAIQKMKDKFGDGLTFEIYSYCKKDDDAIWRALKNEILTTGTECSIKYQISSDSQPEDKWINYEYIAP